MKRQVWDEMAQGLSPHQLDTLHRVSGQIVEAPLDTQGQVLCGILTELPEGAASTIASILGIAICEIVNRADASRNN